MTTSTEPLTLFEISGEVRPEPRLHYIRYPFQVPQGIRRLHVHFDFHKEQLAQLFLSLHGPNGFRGNRMNPGAKGDVHLELWITADDASEGALPGIVEPGEWIVQIDVEAIGEDVAYSLRVDAEPGESGDPVVLDYPADQVVSERAGWYRGELHAHSTESDGKHSVATVIEAAIDTELDFFALTDHFTVSQWRKMAPYAQHIALLRSCEVTSHQGHANLHGMTEWVDVFVDRDDWSMNDVADAVHEQGGLFCVNHAFSGRLGWRAYDFDFDKADLMEIYHNLEDLNNVYQVSLWDRLLSAGHRIVGVTGIDSHDPFEGRHKLGQLFTTVYADELSEAGIIAGLRRGQVYVTRGLQLQFSATNGEQTAQMWEELALFGGSATFTLDILPDTDEDLRVFIFKNGLNFDSFVIEGGADIWRTITFDDTPHEKSYYRVEVHQQWTPEGKPWMQYRDHNTMRAMSNPIWLR